MSPENVEASVLVWYHIMTHRWFDGVYECLKRKSVSKCQLLN